MAYPLSDTDRVKIYIESGIGQEVPLLALKNFLTGSPTTYVLNGALTLPSFPVQPALTGSPRTYMMVVLGGASIPCTLARLQAFYAATAQDTSPIPPSLASFGRYVLTGAEGVFIRQPGAAIAAFTINDIVAYASGGFVVPSLRSALYVDDFETPGLINGRANWQSISATNYPNFEAISGYLHNSLEYTAPSDILFGPSFADFIATVGYDTSGVGETDSGWDATRQYFNVWYVDANNYVRATIDKTNSRLAIQGFKAGSSVAATAYFAGVTWQNTGQLTIQCKAGKLRVRVDGKWLNDAGLFAFPYDTLDFGVTLATTPPNGKFGFNFGTWRYAQAQYVTVDPLYVSVDYVDQFVGRNVVGGTNGDCLVSGTYSGTPVKWVYRLKDYVTKAVVQDWLPLKSPTAAAGAWSGLATLPVGGPYEIEAGYADASNVAFTNTSKATLCGIRGMTWGQSNSENRRFGATGYTLQATASTGQSQGFDAPTNTWFNASTFGATQGGAYLTAKVMANALGVPVGVDAQGVASQTIANLSPGGAYWSRFTDAVAAKRGVVEFVLWDQGEGDADGAFSPTTYSSFFRGTLMPGIVSATGNSAIIVVISPVGRYASAAQPYLSITPAQNDAQREVLRQQYLDIIANDSRVTISDSKLGTTHLDEYHYTRDVTGYVEIARRAGYSLAKRFGATIADGRGAMATGVTRAGAVLTIALNLNGGSSVTGPTTLATGTVPTPTLGNAVNGIQVSADNFATTLPITSVAVAANNLVVTLASAPGAAVKVRSHYGWSYDDTSLFYTNYADGRAPIPVDTIKAPLTSN